MATTSNAAMRKKTPFHVPILAKQTTKLMATPAKRLVSCPHCGKPSLFAAENLFRPFCSERCKMIDLGHWAAEDYRIPATDLPDDTPADDAPS